MELKGDRSVENNMVRARGGEGWMEGARGREEEGSVLALNRVCQ